MKNYQVYIIFSPEGKPSYVGISKNLYIRLKEHVLYNDAAIPDSKGRLDFRVSKFITLEKAQILEKRLIQKHSKYVSNRASGGQIVLNPHPTGKRKRRRRCKWCGKLFQRLGSHQDKCLKRR